MSAKTLKFQNYLMQPILSGEKTVTWRIFDEKNFNVGDELVLINKTNSQEFGRARVLFVNEKKIKDITKKDYKDHGDFSSKEKMMDIFKGYYGDKLNEDNVVKIIKFKLL